VPNINHAIRNKSAAFRRHYLLPSSGNIVLDVNIAAVVSEFYSESTCLVNVRTEANKLKEELESTKVKVKVKVILEQATKAQRGSRCIALLFL
jgi:ribosomal protein L9